LAPASGAANALRPAMLPHQGEALGVIDQRCEIDQVQCAHGDKRSCKGGELPSRFYHPGIFPPQPSFLPLSTPDPEKSLGRDLGEALAQALAMAVIVLAAPARELGCGLL